MSKDETLKKLPVHKTDKAAEDFVDNSDLSEFDLSDLKPMRFEFEKKTKQVNLRMPEGQVDALKKLAAKRGVPYQRLIREGVERLLQDSR